MQIYHPGTRIGQFEIASNPMIGGMGVVYFCLDHANDGHPVALKTFKPEYLLPDRAARDRFLREGTAWVQLGRHPHIVRCYAVEYIDPTAFLVLELIAKEQGMDDASLRSWMGAPMPLEQALLFALQIARGMKHATEKIPGFVHRDLKPENVLVGADKLPGTNINRLRVTDFGLATMLQGGSDQLSVDSEPATVHGQSSMVDTRTQLTHGIVGTPLYMAPEQWKGEPVGIYTDVYALGCILYEMLTGERAADGKTIRELQSAHCSGKLHPLPADLPHELRDILTRSLALQPAQRFQSWDNMVGTLEQAYQADGLGSVPQEGDMEAENVEERQQAGFSYIEMGLAYLDMGKEAVAAEYFERAVTVGEQEQERWLESSGLNNLGNAYRCLGDARRAIEYQEKALVIQHEIGNRFGEGQTSCNLGTAYSDLGDTQQAIRYQEQALVIRREIGDQAGQGADLCNLGVIYLGLGDTRRAIGYFEQALMVLSEIGERRWAGNARRWTGNALGNLGNTYRQLGDTMRAIGFFEQHLGIAREIGDQNSESQTLKSLGVAYLDLGDARHAVGFFEQALVIDRETGDRHGEGAALGNLGLVHADLGDTRRAIEYFEQCLKLHREIGDRSAEEIDLDNLGTALIHLGNPQRAIGYYQQYLAIAREIGDRRGEGRALGNLGSTYDKLGEVQRALGFLEQGLAVDREVGDIDGVAMCSINMAFIYAQEGKSARALPFAQEAARIWTQIGNPKAQAAQQFIARLLE